MTTTAPKSRRADARRTRRQSPCDRITVFIRRHTTPPDATRRQYEFEWLDASSLLPCGR